MSGTMALGDCSLSIHINLIIFTPTNFFLITYYKPWKLKLFLEFNPSPTTPPLPPHP